LRRLRAELMDRIGRRYRVVPQPIRLGELGLRFFRIADPDTVLDETVAEEDRRLRAPATHKNDPPRMPYWAELWDSALALGQVIARSFDGFGTVLDLGCGMGLAGAAAAARGGNVVLADLETPALLLARLNTLAWHDRVHVRRVNWQKDNLHRRFDLILGADILYERAQWPFLEKFWQMHLSTGGQIMLAEPCRSGCDEFQKWISACGWNVSFALEPVSTSVGQTRIFQLSRRNEAGTKDKPIKNARDFREEIAGAIEDRGRTAGAV